MKFPSFDYAAPAALDDALELLAAQEDDAQALAGGQSLLPMMAFRMARPALLVDISHLAELRAISDHVGEAVRIGAATTHAAIEDHAVAGRLGAFLARVASGIAYRAIRNRGTIGGSLAQADPSADWPLVLAALDARVRLRSVAATRDVAVRDFVTGPLETLRQSGELIIDIAIDQPVRALGYAKSVRKAGEFAEALAIAVMHESRAEVWLGVVGGRPVAIDLDAAALDGRPERLIGSVAYREAIAAVEAVADTSDDYVVHLAAVTACRAIIDAQATTRNVL